MGKSLIIKDADFSANGIASEFTKLSWIGMPIVPNVYTDSGLIFADGDPNNPNDELEFCLTIDSSKIQDDENWLSGFRSMGSGYNTMSNCYVWFGKSFLNFYFGGQSKQKSTYSYISLSDGNPHTFKINKYGGVVDDDTTTFAYDEVADLSSYSAAQLSSGSVYLDSRRVSSGSSDNYLHATSEDAVKIHWVKYRRNGEVILDAIPVKRNSDNKIGYYNRVNGAYMFRNDDSSTPMYGTL